MNEHLIFPDKLKEGSRVGIVTPSGCIEPSFIDGAEMWLRNLGFEVELAPHARGENGRFCGTIDERLEDFQLMLDSSDIDAILCSRGGYGAVHLLDRLDLSCLKKKSKWLIGYSDITAFHQLFFQRGFVSLHAPMARHLSEDPNNAASLLLKDILLGNMPQYHVTPHQLNIAGETEGTLVGGNLSVFAGLMGSRYADVPQGTILFIEDIGERAYAIDRMIWNLKLAGVFDKVSAVIVGQFTDCPEDPKMYYDIYTSIYQMLKDYNIPVVFNFPVGHLSQNFPLVHGAKHKLHVSSYGVFLNLVG